MKSCISFRGAFEGCNGEKNGETTEGKGSIVKHEETQHEGGRACGNPLGWSSMCDGPIETVEYIW